MTEQPWKAVETRVYTDDGGFDIRNLPNATDRAAFIVKAVNNHDALVNVLQQILDGSRNKEIGNVEFRVRAAQAAHGALALVERGKET